MEASDLIKNAIRLSSGFSKSSSSSRKPKQQEPLDIATNITYKYSHCDGKKVVKYFCGSYNIASHKTF